ncbi:MAG: lipase family protein [Treponemataceae bacterium]|nr:lipase family protein [Treponemataceae bacterium]
MLKRITYVIALCLIALAIFGCNGQSFNSRETVTWKTSPEVYAYVKANYNGDYEADGLLGTWIAAQRTDEDQPISIAEAVLKDEKGKRQQVYLVALSGTELVYGQSTGVITDLLSGFCLDSWYLRNVCAAIKDAVPAGSNLVITGHSLGGMIAQQVAADSDIKADYNVLNTLTFGSPLLAAGSREGTTKRLGDTSDVVPYLSGSLFNNTLWAILGLNRESGNYGLDFLSAHNNSYGRSDVWGKYDVLGYKNGKAKISVYLDSIKYYENPVF